MEEKLTAKGIDIHGNEIEFYCTIGRLNCYGKKLISLTIPKGVKAVRCWNNQLTELNIPEGVNDVYCDDNKLTELIIPEGVKDVSCSDNQITHIYLPSSIETLYADKEVTGLEKYIGTDVKINLY